MKNKQRYIPIDGKLVPITEEQYEAFYKPIRRVHYHANKHGQCGCSDWRQCEGDCGLYHYRMPVIPFHSKKNRR